MRQRRARRLRSKPTWWSGPGLKGMKWQIGTPTPESSSRSRMATISPIASAMSFAITLLLPCPACPVIVT